MTSFEEAVRLVEQDVRDGIGAWLEPSSEGHGFRVVDPFGGDPGPIGSGEGVVAVPWAWRGTHTGALMGYRPTRKVVDLQGVTLVRVEGGEPQLSRFVDWVGGLAQIGVGLANRPVRDAAPDAGR